MTEIKVNFGLDRAVSILEQTVGARRYWLHNRVGGDDWEVVKSTNGTTIKIHNAKMLTYFLLKLK
jgi:hypothetical protein